MAREQINYPVGERLPGTKYVVVRKLGQGGMGVVLEVVKEPKIRAVVKIIHPKLAAQPEFRQRFFDEVRLLAELDHPNIVRVTDYDQLADGTPYFVMELLHGSNVRQVLKSTKGIQPIHLYQIMRGLLEGLAYAHTHDPPVVHRDIKTENVFIHVPAYGDPCIKIIDFGVAGGESIVEQNGLFVGTLGYAAPEQLRGKPATPRADLYSAGLILYEGLAGRGPFDDVEMHPIDQGDPTRALLRAHLQVPPPPVRTFAPWVPEAIDRLLQSALAKDPRDRPESAYAFATQLYVLQFVGSGSSLDMTAPTLQTMTESSPPPSTRAEPEDLAATRAMPPIFPVQGPPKPIPAAQLDQLSATRAIAPASPQYAVQQPGSGQAFDQLSATRAAGPQNELDATVIDASPGGLLALAGVQRPPPSPGPIQSGVQSPLRPRSFAEAEAAKRASGDYRIGGMTGFVAQRDVQAARAETEVGASRAAVAAVQRAEAPSRSRGPLFWVIALGIPVIAFALFAVLSQMRRHVAVTRPAPPAPTSAPAPVAPLPPDDPSPRPSAVP